jgi:hypothetical protein
MTRILPVLVAALIFVLPMPGGAQATGSVEFNLFELEGATANRIFIFDEAYSAQYDIPVPVPFSLEVPVQDEVELIADGRPDGGGFVLFTFATGEPRQFLENIQVVTATIPIPAEGEVENPQDLRLQLAVNLLQERVFPVAVRGFDVPEILATEVYEFNDHMGVHLIGRYVDPAIGPMLLRLTAHLNPNAPQTYLTVANINLTMVPVTDGETLRRSLSARVANSLTFR